MEAKYNYVGDFSEGLAWFRLKDKWGSYKYGFIDKYGKEVVEAKYHGVGSFYEGLACVLLNGRCGFTDKNGKEVVEAKYDLVREFHEGLAWVKSNGKYGLINKDGEEITDICFDDISISDEMVIFNRSYAIPIKDLKFSYECKIRIDGKEDIFKFDSKEKRDKFYEKMEVKINDKIQGIKILKKKSKEEISNAGNKLYRDGNLEKAKKVKVKVKRKKMD